MNGWQRCVVWTLAAGLHGGVPIEDRMLRLFADLEQARIDHHEVRFDLTEAELNEYIVHALRRTPRPGLAGAQVKFFPGNYMATLTTVDFDAVERWKPGTIPALLKPVLSGQRKVQVDMRFAPAEGLVRFRVEKAEFEGVPIPAAVVNEVIRVVAARQPEHYDTTKPVPLPFGLKTFWTTAGHVLGQNY